MTSDWQKQIMRGFYVGFTRPEEEEEKHDFHCGVDCVNPCEGCAHGACCESFGEHPACAECEWRCDCLNNKEAEMEHERRDRCCVAG